MASSAKWWNECMCAARWKDFCSFRDVPMRALCPAQHRSIVQHWNGRFFVFPISNKFQPTMSQILQNIYFLWLSSVAPSLPIHTSVGSCKTQFIAAIAVFKLLNIYEYTFQVWNVGSPAINRIYGNKSNRHCRSLNSPRPIRVLFIRSHHAEQSVDTVRKAIIHSRLRLESKQ